MTFAHRGLASRRGFLRAAAAATAGALLGRAARLPAAGTLDTLPDVEERSSVAGVLETSMRLAFAANTVGPYDLYTRTFDGGIPGPTLRVRPGDTLRIHFDNDMPPNPDPVRWNEPHHYNSFNFHTHGMHVDPTGNADNVFLVVRPGTTHTTEIHVPDDHPAGTFWYHPHKHGAVRGQIMSGMAGALIVEGAIDAVPEVAAAAERLIMIQEMRVHSATGMISEPGEPPDEDLRLWLVNGAILPTLVMRPGEVQRLRVVHAGLTETRDLALDGHDLVQLAYDGITFDAPRTVPRVTLAPANRADLLVRAGVPGSYALRLGSATLATVVVEGTPLAMDLPTALPGEPRHPTVTDDEVVFHRTIVFGRYPNGNWDMDGRLYDEYRIDHAVPLGNVEEWTIRNDTPVSHPFHIHTNPFEVFEYNGSPLPRKTWMDVVNVPAGARVKFRIRFEDFLGKAVAHCHILGHGDAGMMQNVLVWEPEKILPPILDLLLSS